MIFENSHDLAKYLLEDNDPRKWGYELRDFDSTPIYMQYKYKGIKNLHPIIEKRLGERKEVSYEEVLNAFIDYIDSSSLTFPVIYQCRADDFIDPHFAYFNVTYTPTNQVSLW